MTGEMRRFGGDGTCGSERWKEMRHTEDGEKKRRREKTRGVGSEYVAGRRRGEAVTAEWKMEAYTQRRVARTGGCGAGMRTLEKTNNELQLVRRRVSRVRVTDD